MCVAGSLATSGAADCYKGEPEVNHWSDRTLITSILAGNREASGQLIHRHYTPIYQLLAHLCRDVHEAEDLTQETFAAAWANIAAFGGFSSLKTWLHQIAYRKFVDACRRKDRTVAREPDVEIYQLSSQEASPQDEAIANDEFRLLQRAIGFLKPAEKSVIVLRYLQGLSYHEVAEVTGEPLGTIRWRTSCALERLRHLLNGKNEHERGSTAVS